MSCIFLRNFIRIAIFLQIANLGEITSWSLTNEKVYSLAEPETPKLVIPIDKDIEVSVCGPHLLLRNIADENQMKRPVDQIGINFIRIEFDTLNWFYKTCFVPYPAQAIDDLTLQVDGLKFYSYWPL